MMTKRRPVLLGGLAAVVLGVSLTAWQAPAGAAGGGHSKPPAAKACVKPAPKDVKGIEADKRAGSAKARSPKDELTAAQLKAKIAANPPVKDKAGRNVVIEEKVGPAGGPRKNGCRSDGGSIDLKALAREFRIPVARLEAGLIAAKRTGGGGEAAVRAFAKAAGVSLKVAKAVIGTVFGEEEHKDHSRAEMAKAIAKALGVSVAAAEKALERLNQAGGIEPDSALFKSVAHDLGVTPKQLNEALRAWKRAEGSKG
jgi:hypothetical protein